MHRECQGSERRADLPAGPPTVKGAKLGDVVQEELSWGQYLDRTQGLHRAPYDAAALRQRGIYVDFHFSIDGYRDKELPLRYELLDARNGDQLGQSSNALIVPTAQTDSGRWSVWVPLGQHAARPVNVELILYDQTGKIPLDDIRTPTILAPRG